MVQGRFKSRTFRRVKVKTPGGKTVTHYRKGKHKIAHCSNCGVKLKGMPRETPGKIKKIPKTKRRPERPYGGMLCSKCMREKIKQEARI